MRNKSGTAFLNALAVQRRRMQQGFENRPDIGPTRGADVLADVGELTILYEGPHGADIDPIYRKM
jgi:hypothetical protein